MSLKIKRPRGVTAFVILGILDAIAMVIFIGMFFGTPDLYANLFDVETELDLGQEYAILEFNDHVLGFGIFVIIVDIIAIKGLLLPKPSGQKIVIGCAIAGIVFNSIIFGIPGLISNSILLWYITRKYTKEYFAYKN